MFYRGCVVGVSIALDIHYTIYSHQIIIRKMPVGPLRLNLIVSTELNDDAYLN